MSSYQEMGGILALKNKEAAEKAKAELIERGYFNETPVEINGVLYFAWNTDSNESYTPVQGLTITLNGGAMKNFVSAIEQIIDIVGKDSVDVAKTFMRGFDNDSGFTLYEYCNREIKRLDDDEIAKSIDGYSWEAYEAICENDDYQENPFDDDAYSWLAAIEKKSYEIANETNLINVLLSWAKSYGYELEYHRNTKLDNIYNCYLRKVGMSTDNCIKAFLYSSPLDAVTAACNWLCNSYKSVGTFPVMNAANATV